MSSPDTAWLHMDRPTNLMVITTALWFDEPLDWQRVREVVRTRLVDRFPRFRQRASERRLPVAGPVWEDDPHFDLDLHLHRVALPAPGSRTELQELVGDLMSIPLDRSQALWQMYFVDGYAGGGAAIVARMHHCIADGIALARVMLSLTDAGPDGAVEIAPPRVDDGAAGGPIGAVSRPLGALLRPATAALAATPKVAGAIAGEAREIWRRPEQLLDRASTASADAEALAKVVLAGPDPKTAFKGELSVARRAAWTDAIALDEIKSIGRATGTTVNDVLLTAVAGALRQYLEANDDMVPELRAMVPFNLRPLDEPLPAELGNKFGLVFLSLPLGIRDGRRRLAEVHRRMDEIKTSREGVVAYGVLSLLGIAPAEIEQRVIDMFTAKATAVMTNVPGPREPVQLAGVPVSGVLVWAPCSGDVSMSVSIFSYAGQVTVGLMVDAGLVPEPEAITTAVAGEIRGLRRLSRQRRRDPHRTGPPTGARSTAGARRGS